MEPAVEGQVVVSGSANYGNRPLLENPGIATWSSVVVGSAKYGNVLMVVVSDIATKIFLRIGSAKTKS